MKRLIIFALATFLLSCKGNSQQKENPSVKTEEKEETFPYSKTDAEWRASLTDMEYYVLRRAGTEVAGTSELLKNKEKGTYVCAGCGFALFRSENKYDSGSGWPSFDREIEDAIAYDVDYKIGYKRTEELCANCGGHLGHVFEDGPRETTGLRHCINGAALDFIPDNQ